MADWKEDVTAVNERENFRIYFPAGDERFLEFNFGYWYKFAAAKFFMKNHIKETIFDVRKCCNKF